MMFQRLKTKAKTKVVVAAIGTVAFVSLVAVVPTYAQMADIADLKEISSRNSVSIPPAQNPFSLFDLSKVKFSQSYSLMYGSSSFGSGSVGLYTGSLLYEFSPVLSMALSVGVSHNPGALFDRAQQNNSAIFPGFELDYHPNNNFRMRLSIVKSPYAGGYNGAYSGFRNSYSPYGSAFGASPSYFSPFSYPTSWSR